MIHALFTIIGDFLIILVDDVHICVQVIIPLHANTVFCIYNEDIINERCKIIQSFSTKFISGDGKYKSGPNNNGVIR